MIELDEMEVEKSMDMFDGINYKGMCYFLGFMGALIIEAKKNGKSSIDIDQIEIGIESAKRNSKDQILDN